jgi:hypothetical protein
MPKNHITFYFGASHRHLGHAAARCSACGCGCILPAPTADSPAAADVISPWAQVGFRVLQRYVDIWDAEVAWKPLNLGRVMQVRLYLWLGCQHAC